MTLPGETVTILRGTPVADPYSGEAAGDLDWEDPTETELAGCLFDPGTNGEPVTDWRSGRSESPTLFAPAGTDPDLIDPADRIVVRGDTYEVEGRPQDWRLGATPFGLVIRLTRFGG